MQNENNGKRKANLEGLFSDENITEDITDEITRKVKKEIDKKNSTIIKDESLIPKEKSNKIFIVHGHDEALKNEVARFVEKFGLEAVILHEQPNNGKTIIEKLLDNASDSGFAIILYTPCDEGYKKGENNDVKDRARQNVILEHGLFIGILGRNNVVALVKGDIETPSDISGILYIPYFGNWKFDLAKEMKTSGLEIDMNKII